MPQGNIRSLLILGAITAVSLIAALAQPVHSQESSLSRDSDSWRDAQLATGSSRRLDVVTISLSVGKAAICRCSSPTGSFAPGPSERHAPTSHEKFLRSSFQETMV